MLLTREINRSICLYFASVLPCPLSPSSQITLLEWKSYWYLLDPIFLVCFPSIPCNPSTHICPPRRYYDALLFICRNAVLTLPNTGDRGMRSHLDLWSDLGKQNNKCVWPGIFGIFEHCCTLPAKSVTRPKIVTFCNLLTIHKKKEGKANRRDNPQGPKYRQGQRGQATLSTCISSYSVYKLSSLSSSSASHHTQRPHNHKKKSKIMKKIKLLLIKSFSSIFFLIIVSRGRITSQMRSEWQVGWGWRSGWSLKQWPITSDRPTG